MDRNLKGLHPKRGVVHNHTSCIAWVKVEKGVDHKKGVELHMRKSFTTWLLDRGYNKGCTQRGKVHTHKLNHSLDGGRKGVHIHS